MVPPPVTSRALLADQTIAAPCARRGRPAENNKLSPEDRPVHDWYRFVLSYPPHLVRQYLKRFSITPVATVLDPFCGTGTTLVECKKLWIGSVGIEANPMAFLASRVKTDWAVDAAGLELHAKRVADETLKTLRKHGIDDEKWFGDSPTTAKVPLLVLPEEAVQLLLTDSISPLPLHKTLVLLECLNARRDDRFDRLELVALAKALVTTIGNLHFGPEVGVGELKADAPVVQTWLANVMQTAADLRLVSAQTSVPAEVLHADSRKQSASLSTGSIDAVITSPPYPNEKDYTRTTRLESVLLGLIKDRQELQAFKRTLMRSNTRNVYKGDDDDRWIEAIPEVHELAEAIEARRVAMGKTSGFERMYARVTRLYFGGMARHLDGLKRALKPGARLAYVVGDQASYLRVMIRTGQILAHIAEHLGYEVTGIDLFRTRLATATREQLREEVVLLRWPGKK
jgi:DNA modification methylase